MQLVTISLVALLSYATLAVASSIERRQALSTATTSECFDITYRHSCTDSTYAQDGASVALGCGPDYVAYAENFAANCAKRSDGKYCLDALFTSATLNFTQAAECSSAVANDSSSCSSACRSFLQSGVTIGECCFKFVFNERLSPSILGHDVRISLDACGVVAQPACSQSDVDLTVPSNVQSCTNEEFLSRLAEFSCSITQGQPWINAVLENRACTPLARHYVNVCGRGVNDTYCFELLGTVNPTVPTRTAFRHPYLSEAIAQCANYSTFQSESCPASCKSALQTAVNQVGCCINIFNDTINEVLLPHFSANVMTACGIESPGVCVSELRAGAVTDRANTALVHIILCLALLYELV